MEKPTRATQKDKQTRQDVIVQLKQFGESLLESSVVHTKVWKRSTFEIPHDQTQEFYQQIMASPVGEMLTGLKGYRQKEGSDKPYDFETIQLKSENPSGAILSVEHFGPYDNANNSSTAFNIIFIYDRGGEGNYYLKTTLTNHVQEEFKYKDTVIKPYDYWSLSSVSFQHDMSETGYEGSDQKYKDNATKAHLQSFMSIFRENTKDKQIKEKTFSEQMSEQKMVNEDTGEVFYYDPSRQEYFNAEGIPMDKSESPLANLPNRAKLKVIAQYAILPLEEGEHNPFVKVK